MTDERYAGDNTETDGLLVCPRMKIKSNIMTNKAHYFPQKATL